MPIASNRDLPTVLASLTGLLRGYVVTQNSAKRTSPLLLEDFVDQLGQGNVEQMGRSGSKEKTENKEGERSSNSLFSKVSFGETHYLAYGSISVEQLAFISLDQKFDRHAMVIKSNQGQEVATGIEDFIKQLARLQQELDQAENRSMDHAVWGRIVPEEVEACFHENYVRQGTLFEQGEQGILLNDMAVTVIMRHMVERIETFSIRQGKGYMYVDDVQLDFNASHKMMRIKRAPDECRSQKGDLAFARYFTPKDLAA
jgi:hypothetical protein